MQKYKRVVVFDFDETLGQFSQPSTFWYHLKNFLIMIFLILNIYLVFLIFFLNILEMIYLKFYLILRKKEYKVIATQL